MGPREVRSAVMSRPERGFGASRRPFLNLDFGGTEVCLVSGVFGGNGYGFGLLTFLGVGSLHNGVQ